MKSDDEFYKELETLKFSEFEAFLNIKQFSEIFNRFDSTLETLVKSYKESQMSDIQTEEESKTEAGILNILKVFQKLLKC